MPLTLSALQRSLDGLQPGDSTFVALNCGLKKASISQYVHLIRKRTNKSFVVRSRTEDGQTGYRIWAAGYER